MLTKVFTSHGVIGLKEPIGDPPTLTHPWRPRGR